MTYLIYGAYGYTGSLIVEEAVRRGHTPILAGRNPSKLNSLADRHGLETRAVGLDAPQSLRAVLEEVPAVLHCAGPFLQTAAPMVAACLHTGTDYLDITGEIPVFQSLMARNAEAEAEGVTLLPGVGFDVVPTDCLARGLAEQMPSAETLEIALHSVGGVSTGTLKTVIEQVGAGGRVRRNGRIVEVPPAWTSRSVSFPDHPRQVVSIPGGDLVTAGHSTGIPNVTVYLYLPALVRTLLRFGRLVSGVVRWPVVQMLLKRLVERYATNPSADARAQGSTQVWASVRGPDGARQSTCIRGPHAYTLTARTAVGAAEQVIDGDPAPGFHTPSTALGSDFIFQVEGVQKASEAEGAES